MIRAILLLMSIVVAPMSWGNLGLDAWVDHQFGPISAWISGVVFSHVSVWGISFPWIVVWLVLAGVMCSVLLSGIQVFGLREAWRLVLGRDDSPAPLGEVSHFQALTTAISGTVGIGNIGGVAVAVSLGGPGATLWMIVGGLLGMATKFMECSLAVVYRRIDQGTVTGGPMVYLPEGFRQLGWPRLGQFLGTVYAVLMVCACLGAGNMFQSNQAFHQLVFATGGVSSWFADKGWLVGGCMAVFVGCVIIGGIRSIVRVTEKIVPLMAGIYVLSAGVMLGFNAHFLPQACALIWTQAFTPVALKGGLVGVMMIGFQRAFFSNEAGLGSAAIAHAAAQTGEPLTQGFVALLEPFIDTVIICTLTELVITTASLQSPALMQSQLLGIELTSQAFTSQLSFFAQPLSIAVFLFAFSTMISWSYYGLKAWQILVGPARVKAQIFQIVFCVFIILGSMVQLKSVVAFSDACLFILSVPNVIGLYFLGPQIRARLKRYRSA